MVNDLLIRVGESDTLPIVLLLNLPAALNHRDFNQILDNLFWPTLYLYLTDYEYYCYLLFCMVCFDLDILVLVYYYIRHVQLESDDLCFLIAGQLILLGARRTDGVDPYC